MSLFFVYATMNSGKSTHLLQNAYNYRERGMVPVLYTAAIDDRYGVGNITSRIGISSPAKTFSNTTDFLIEFEMSEEKCDIIFIDESQFLTALQVEQLCVIVDSYNVPVMAYGLKTDYQCNLFEGSKALLQWADKLVELKAICSCGKKATTVARIDESGNMVLDGDQVEIGGNSRYQSYCRKCYIDKRRRARHGDHLYDRIQ